MRELLRRIPYLWRQRLRLSTVGCLLRVDKWLP